MTRQQVKIISMKFMVKHSRISNICSVTAVVNLGSCAQGFPLKPKDDETEKLTIRAPPAHLP